MALWQVDYQVKPKGRDDFVVDDKVDDTANKVLGGLLTIEKSWDSDTIQFGTLESTCVEITSFDDLVEIRCRFDMRSLTKEELNVIIEFVSSIGGIFVNQSKTYEAEWNILVRELKSSRAFQLCENPQKFFGDFSLQK